MGGIPRRGGGVTTILRDLDQASLAAGLERGFADLQAHYARGVGGKVRELGDVRFSATGLPARVVNAVNLARLKPESASDRIAEAIAFFGGYGVPFRWFVGPTSGPSDLPDRLEAAGLPAISNTPGMALDIGAMRDEPATEPGLTIGEVTSAADLEEWLETCRVAFPFDDPTALSWRKAHEALGWGEERPLRNYVARIGGRPVGVSALMLNGEVAGIWNVGTLSEFRGRGIGREVTLAALREARSRGYRAAILGSSPLGLPVYRHIGFVEVCRVRHFGPPIPS
jgi:GNAT superfamily N-acetyltransferase